MDITLVITIIISMIIGGVLGYIIGTIILRKLFPSRGVTIVSDKPISGRPIGYIGKKAKRKRPDNCIANKYDFANRWYGV